MTTKSPLSLAIALLAFVSGCAHYQPEPIPKDGGVPTEVEIFRAASSVWWIQGTPASRSEIKKLKKEQKDIAAKRVELEARKKKNIALGANEESDLRALEEANAAKLVAAVYGWQENPGITPEQKKAFLLAGLNLSDHLADEWLKKHLRKDTDSRFWKNTLNTALSLTTAALGWTSASGKIVTGVGATGVALNAEWSNYEAAYLISSALPKVIEKLKKYRTQLRSEILTQFTAKNFSYLETRDIIDKYHDTISRESVKNFIDSSIELAEARYAPAGQPALDGIAAKTANAALYQAVYGGKVGEFSVEELTALYLQMMDPAGNQTGQLESTGQYSSLLTAVKTIRTAAAAGGAGNAAAVASKAEIDRVLGQLDKILGLRIKAEALKKTVTPGGTPKLVEEQLNFVPAVQAVR